jgi:hypothetical protein
MPRKVGRVIHDIFEAMRATVAQCCRLSALASQFASRGREFGVSIRKLLSATASVVRSLAAFAGPSLRRITSQVHRHHFRHNPTIASFRYSWWRSRMNTITRYPLLSLSLLISLFITGVLASQYLISEAQITWLVSGSKRDNIQDVAIGLLAAQAALIALVFPLIIALIGVLFELRTTSGARIDIFLKETESIAVGGSALILSAALAIQLLLFPHVSEAACITMIAFDILWFVANVVFIAFFLFNTLNYVRPERRATLYQRYVVNVAWRAELWNLIAYNRLTQAIEYGYLPATAGDLEHGPKVIVSGMNLDSVPAAVQISLRQSSILSNVALPVLRVVAQAWLERASAQSKQTGLTWLVFQPVPLVSYDNNLVIARTPRDLPLTPLERFFVRRAFRFHNSATDRKVAYTASLLKEQVGDLLPLIDAGRIQEFDSGLSQIVDLHVFLFKIAQSPERTPSEVPFSFAEVTLFEFETIGESWAREYRDILKRAVARLESEPEFFSTCAYLGVRLYRQAKEAARPAALTSIVTLALTLFWRFREWAEASAQAEAGRAGNPGNAFRFTAARASIYAEAWRNYVAGWERLGTEIASFGLDAPEDWPKLNGYYAPVFDHLRSTATMVAAGAKGGDLLAVDWSTDMLIKWYEQVRRIWGNQDDDLLSDGILLTPDILLAPWTNVRDINVPLIADTLQPHTVLASVVAHAHTDVQLVLICVLIHWSLQSSPAGAAAMAARKLLRGEAYDHDSEADHRRISFDSAGTALKALLRIGYAERRVDGGYGTTIASLAGRLDDLNTEPYVAGRIYSSDRVHGLYQLRIEQALMLAVLASRAPRGGALPADIQAALERISSEDDTHARRLIAQLENSVKVFANSTRQRTAKCFQHLRPRSEGT